MKTLLNQRPGKFCRLPLFLRFLVVCGVWTFALTNVHAEENLGKLELAGFLLEPTAAVRETGGGNSGFSLGATKASIAWTHDPALRARLTLGQQTLIGRPTWAGINSSNWGLIEAFGEYSTGLGMLRMGWIPVGFGFEGRKDEAHLLFPRTLLFQNRVVGLRDLGVSYQITNQGFYTRLVVHNGEASEDEDNRTLQTALWGWRGGAGLHTGMSATAGRYVAADKQERRFRVGNLFASMDLYGVGFCAEGTLGESKTDSSAQQFLGWHIDLQHSLTPSLGMLARFDSYDPDVFRGADLQKEWHIGLSFKNEHETSRVFVYGIKRFEEPIEKSNDEIRVVWRLNSSYSSTAGSWGKTYGDF